MTPMCLHVYADDTGMKLPHPTADNCYPSRPVGSLDTRPQQLKHVKFVCQCFLPVETIGIVTLQTESLRKNLWMPVEHPSSRHDIFKSQIQELSNFKGQKAVLKANKRQHRLRYILFKFI